MLNAIDWTESGKPLRQCRTKGKERANEHQAVISLEAERKIEMPACVCVYKYRESKAKQSKAKEAVNLFSERSACDSSSANQETSQTVRAVAASFFKENRKL